MTMTQGASQRMSLRVAAQLRLFYVLAERDGKAISAAELAKESNADELLIGI